MYEQHCNMLNTVRLLAESRVLPFVRFHLGLSIDHIAIKSFCIALRFACTRNDWIKWNVQICHFVRSNYYLNELERTYCSNRFCMLNAVFLAMHVIWSLVRCHSCCRYPVWLAFMYTFCSRKGQNIVWQALTSFAGSRAYKRTYECTPERHIIIIDWWHFHSCGWNIV